MISSNASPRFPWRKVVSRFVQYSVLSVIVVIVLIPIVMLVFSGLKTRGDAYANPYTPPIPPQWQNIVHILTREVFWQMLLNSLIVVVATTAAVLLVTSLAAFVFSRMRFRLKPVIFNILTLGLMFPINIAILPVFLLVRQIPGLHGTLLSVIIVQTAFQLSGNIMILRGFFSTIPSELQDAASIDGCSSFDFFWRILLPLAKPALGAVGALTMIASWNDLLVPLVLIDKDTLWTLPLGTMQFQGQYGQDISLVSAFVAISALPAILFYLIAERQIIAGLTSGAVKS